MPKQKIHFSDRKGYTMKSKLLSAFVRWYRKWIIGECRHFCTTCPYKDECKHDEEWWLDITTLGYFDKDNYGTVKQEKEMTK